MYVPAVTVAMESGRTLRIRSPIQAPSTLLPVPWPLVAVIRDVDVPRRQTDRRHFWRETTRGALSPARRKLIAQKAAKARWAKR